MLAAFSEAGGERCCNLPFRIWMPSGERPVDSEMHLAHSSSLSQKSLNSWGKDGDRQLKIRYNAKPSWAIEY